MSDKTGKGPRRREGPPHMAGMMPAEKPKNFRMSMGRLLQYLKPQRTRLMIVLIASLFSVSFNLWGPKVLEGGINIIVEAFLPPGEIRVADLGLKPSDFEEIGIAIEDGMLHTRQLPEGALNEETVEVLLQSIDWETVELGALGFAPIDISSVGLDDAQLEAMGLSDAVEDGKLELAKVKLSPQMAAAFMEMFQGGAGDLAELDVMTLFKKPVQFGALGQLLLFMLGLYIVSSIFGWLQGFLMADISRGVIYDLRKQVDEKLARLPLSYYDSSTRGELLSRVTNDVDNVGATMQQNLVQVISSVLTLVGVIIMMFTIDVVMTLLCLLILPIVFGVTGQIMKRSQKHFGQQWAATGDVNGHVEEMFSGHNVVRVFGREKEAMEVFDRHNKDLTRSSFKAQFISGVIMPLMGLVNNVNFVSICVYGGVQVAAGNLSLGSVIAMTQYARQYTQPIAQTASIMNILQSTAASAERIFELLDAEEQTPEAVDSVCLKEIEGRVGVEGIAFRYREDIPLIEELNLSVEPGQRVAIVGPTGAGKTTIVNLLMRFYELNGGEITVDGVDITQMKRDELRACFGMVLQDTWLFSGTIRENIGYGKLGSSHEEIEEAARAAHADHFIRTLSEGYDTVVGDDANNISQGQRQLLTIARAFLSDPKILILDEATSSVDTRTEVLIQEAMDRLMHGRTSFIIAHRLSTIRNADTILVMKNGAIVEQGSHDGLMAQKGFYAELYNSQFQIVS